MPKCRLKASVSWVAGSTTEMGEYEFDSEQEAQDAAFEAAAEQLDTWVELVEDEDDE